MAMDRRPDAIIGYVIPSCLKNMLIAFLTFLKSPNTAILCDLN